VLVAQHRSFSELRQLGFVVGEHARDRHALTGHPRPQALGPGQRVGRDAEQREGGGDRGEPAQAEPGRSQRVRI
jgi:hypothetical protein